MRRSIAAAIVSGFAGLALLGATPASADSSGATSASDAVPSCVDTVFHRVYDAFLRVHMTNNCSDSQRVTPTFSKPLDEEPPCYVLQPGQEDTYWSDQVLWAHQYDFTGLVRC